MKKKKFWNKEDSIMDKFVKGITAVVSVISIFLLVGVFVLVSANQGWFRFSQDQTEIYKTNDMTETSQRYEVTSTNGTQAIINIVLTLDFKGREEIVNVGDFKFDYIKSTVYFDPKRPALSTATIIYTLPDNWLKNTISDEASFLIVDKRKQEVRGDPIFYKNKDYPSNLYVNEIEIHVDAVKIYQYKDHNETAYNFVFSTNENSTRFDVVDFKIQGKNLIKGVQP